MPTQTTFSCFTLEERNDIYVVTINQEKLVDDPWITNFGFELKQLVSNPKVMKVVINCPQTTFINSAGLGHLLTLHKKLQQRGHALRFVCVDSGLFQLLQHVRLFREKAFKWLPDLTTAISSFQ